MKNIEYLLIPVILIAYLWRRGKDEMNLDGKEPENFKQALSRGFYETLESLKKFHSNLAPEKPEEEDPDHYSNFRGVRPPAHHTYNPSQTISKFKNHEPKRHRGILVKSDPKKAQEREEAEYLERLNNLY